MLDCVRSSHDEMGALFEFQPIPVKDEEW
jgi:hypothetical protein